MGSAALTKHGSEYAVQVRQSDYLPAWKVAGSCKSGASRACCRAQQTVPSLWLALSGGGLVSLTNQSHVMLTSTKICWVQTRGKDQEWSRIGQTMVQGEMKRWTATPLGPRGGNIGSAQGNEARLRQLRASLQPRNAWLDPSIGPYRLIYGPIYGPKAHLGPYSHNRC